MMYSRRLNGHLVLVVSMTIYRDCVFAAALALFDCKWEQIVGQQPPRFSPPEQPDGQDSAAKARQKLEAALRGVPQHFDWQHIRFDGSPFDAEVSLIQMEIDGDNYIQAIVRVDSERKLAAAWERQRERQLFQAAKMVSLGTLVSGVAHEINNPNNFIRLNAQNLKDFWAAIKRILADKEGKQETVTLMGIPLEQAGPMIDQACQGIQDGSVRIERLVQSLKDYARQDDEDLNQPVEVNGTINSALNIVQSLIKKSTRNFSKHLAENIPLIQGNPHQIEQVIINLVGNACQALPSYDRAVTIRSEYDESTDTVSVTVEDEGVGIANEDLLRIMDPFFTTKRDIGGTGLGLSVSHRIVANHGGKLTFESEPGKGTLARVELPVRQTSIEKERSHG